MKVKHLFWAFLGLAFAACNGNDPIQQPTGLAGEQQGENIMLTWNEVSNAVSYGITRNGDFIGYSNTNSYRDEEPEEGYNLYEVKAFDGKEYSSAATIRVKYERPNNGDDGDNGNGNGGTETADYYIKHSWGSGADEDWTWQPMSKSGSDYVYTGYWGGIGANINTIPDDSGADWFPESDIEGAYSCSVGELIRFTYNPSYASLSVENLSGGNGGENNGGGDNGGGNNGGNNSDPVPSAPTGITVTVTAYYVLIEWKPVSGEVYSYKVYRSTSVYGTYSEIATVNYTYWTDYDFNPATTYYYKVTATNSAGESPMSSYASTNNNSSGGGGTGGGTSSKPSTPTGLSATASSSSISLSWSSVSTATSYNVYRSTSAYGTYSNISSSYTTSYTDYSAIAGTTYYYKVSAVNSAGESSKSSYASAKIASSGGGTGGGNNGGGSTTSKLETPTNLEAYGSSSDSYVQISFDPVALAQGYELYRSKSANSGYSKIAASGGSSGSRYVLTDSSPLSGTSYYKVKAKAPTSSYYNLKDSELSDYVKVTR